MVWYLYIENSRNILYELHAFAVIISKRGIFMGLNAKYSMHRVNNLKGEIL